MVKLLDMPETASGSNVQSTKSICYRNLTWQNNSWQYSTRCIWQAQTIIWRHLGELDALTTKQCMTKQSYLLQYGMFIKLSMVKYKIHSMYGSTTISLAKLHIMLRICQKYFIAKVEQYWVMLWHSINANKGMNGSITIIYTKHP